MEFQYLNKSGKSGVVSFEIGLDHIWVRFQRGGSYRYSVSSLSKSTLEKMIDLAKSGCGLNTFINKFVKNNFDAKKP